MDLSRYFSDASGTGVLSTADDQGRVDAAIYARPHVMPDGTLAFVMRERLTYSNIKVNPHAAYLFIEAGGGYRGVRLFLKKVREDQDPELLAQMTRPSLSVEEDKDKGPKHLVYFSLEKSLPLVGGSW
ncbi:Pyridoxamine 5'-phosphate oxidase [Geoalkalibacter ferrihydriticus]|uniref:Pyridoxamine 5'-phosphate oxidase n=2 Tax=Geoalkalibacter ferrihydriticus TaxID=392333 RepID=A0A0C2HXE4_9BACT|nr:pyridoxamine 5'-phosphate oxidase family protein [Geoalkalibacter ferrihydriticus]KIH77437.1 pyridoxamine 5'-phosphate oxidase [Geoalkalibacter ferrihydriticus DSM 17813]SDM15029.1 Pyridoxamine 5'-phosphate oxidase [Geoalkalibacter ferrihydriticus]